MSSLGRAAHVGFLCAAREGVYTVLPLARARGRESGQEERKPERKEVGGDVSAESGEAALQTDEKDTPRPPKTQIVALLEWRRVEEDWGE